VLALLFCLATADIAGTHTMIAKLTESFFIVILAAGIIGMIHPSSRHSSLSLGIVWFLCGAAVCYVWL
jgi:hypothetical protein